MAIFVSTLNGFGALGGTEQEHADSAKDAISYLASHLKHTAGYIYAGNCAYALSRLLQTEHVLSMAGTHIEELSPALRDSLYFTGNRTESRAKLVEYEKFHRKNQKNFERRCVIPASLTVEAKKRGH